RHAADGAARRDDRGSRDRPAGHVLGERRRAGERPMTTPRSTTAPWEYRDPLEAALAPEVSAKTLMEHVRTIGAWERESGSPGEAQAFDYIERTLKSNAWASPGLRSEEHTSELQ